MKSKSVRIAMRSAHACVCLAILSIVTPPGLCQVVRQMTDSRASGSGSPALDDAGTAVYVNASTNQLGGNPAYRWQIFRFDAATGAGVQITGLTEGVASLPEPVRET